MENNNSRLIILVAVLVSLCTTLVFDIVAYNFFYH